MKHLFRLSLFTLILCGLSTPVFAQDFFTTGQPTVTPEGSNYTISFSFDTTKHGVASSIPLSTISVSGGVYTKTNNERIVSISPKQPDSMGLFRHAIAGGGLNPNTEYEVTLSFSGSGKTETLTPFVFTTQKTATVTPKETPNPNEYKLLAPIPGLARILDPAACQEAQAQNPGEICDINGFINFMLQLIIGICAVILVVRLIIAGYAYMTTDVAFVKMGAKNTFTDALIGLLIALSSYLILNTINPRLVKNSFSIDGVNFEVEVFNRADDSDFVNALDQYDTTGISVDINNLNNLHLGYLAHQQGVAGASAIIWSAKKGYKTVPTDNPYTKANINRNMAANFPKSSAQKTIGTSELTPATFLKYWVTKTEAIRRSSPSTIPAFINDELVKVSQEGSVGLNDLQTMCKIESYRSCTARESITHVNKYGFTGLFQLSQSVWKAYGKATGDIKNAYHNGFAAAGYYKANLTQIKKNIAAMR